MPINFIYCYMEKRRLLAIIRGKTPEQVKEWIKSLDDETCLEVTEQMNEIAKSIPLYKQDKTFRKQVQQSMEAKQKYEETILQKKTDKLMHEIDVSLKMREVDKAYDKLRETLLKEIEKNPPNVEDLKNIAYGMIRIEKEQNLHDASKWPGL